MIPRTLFLAVLSQSRRFAVVTLLAIGVRGLVAYGEDAPCWLEPLNRKNDMTWGSLVQLINEKHIQSIEELVPYLGSHRDYWTMMFESLSPEAHLTSPGLPRVISFGESGVLQLAFNGCKKDEPQVPYPECQNVQVLERVNDLRTEAHVIRFPGLKSPSGAATPLPKPSSLPSARPSSSRVSAKDSSRAKEPLKPIFVSHEELEHPKEGKKCSDCHRQIIQSNWEPYNGWAGSYGSLSRNGFDAMERSSIEARNYGILLMKIREDPQTYLRYSEMTWHSGTDAPMGGFYPTPSEKAEDMATQDFAALYVIQHSKIQNPNAFFSRIAGADLAARTILKTLVSSPRFPKYKMAVASVLEGCDEVAMRIQSSDSRFFQEMRNRALAEAKSQKDLILASNPILEGGWAPLDNVNRSSVDFQNLAMVGKREGVSIENFGTGFMQRSVIDGHEMDALRDLFREYAQKCDRELSDILSRGSDKCSVILDLGDQKAREVDVALPQAQCTPPDTSGKKEVQAQVAQLKPVLDKIPVSPPQSISRCIGCHVAGSQGPEIPFDDPGKLKARLMKKLDGSGTFLSEVKDRLSRSDGRRMPMGDPLGKDPADNELEKKLLIEYFESLAKP